MDIGIMPPSPEKEEEDASRVELDLGLKDLDLELSDLEEEEEVSFADELAEIEERTAGVTVGLPRLKAGEGGKMMELVGQKWIRALMASPPPSKPYSDCGIEDLRKTGITDEEELQTLARGFVVLQSARDRDNDIIRQYRAQGYAYVALPDDFEPPAAASGN